MPLLSQYAPPQAIDADLACATIACWGDSLTLGVGSSGGNDYPSRLAALAGRATYRGGISGYTSSQIKTWMQSDATKFNSSVVIWAGRNNYAAPTTVLADIASMVASLGHNRYVIMSVLNSSAEPSGNSNYTAVLSLNASLASTYPNNYIDIRSYLVSLYNSGIGQDVTDHGNDVPPSSLRSDTVHLNDAGYLAVATRLSQPDALRMLNGSPRVVNPANLGSLLSLQTLADSAAFEQRPYVNSISGKLGYVDAQGRPYQTDALVMRWTPGAGQADWWRVAWCANSLSGTVEITTGVYDGALTSVLLSFEQAGYGNNGKIHQLSFLEYNSGVISKARTSSNGSDCFLDLYVRTATSPTPITCVFRGENLTLNATYGVQLAPAYQPTVGASSSFTLNLGAGLLTSAGVGLWGHAAPTSQPTGGGLTAAGTYGSNEQTMLQALWNAARGIGLIT